MPQWLYTRFRFSDPLAANLPWLPFGAIRFLERRLPRDAAIFEYGSGGSTLWLSRRWPGVTSVEHDPGWSQRVRDALSQARLRGTLLLQERDTTVSTSDTRLDPLFDYHSDVVPGSFERYVKAIDDYADNHFDLVIVDGRCRRSCALHATSKIKAGGLLLLDDSSRDRYQAISRLLHTWKRMDFRGVRPFTAVIGQSSVWVRP